MRKLFSGHFRLDDEAVKGIWKDALFVFDTNVLLSLYRLSPKSSEDLITVLESIKDKVWLPHQFCSEFFNNRTGVIAEQIQNYEKCAGELKKIVDEQFKSRIRHPFVDDETVKKLEGVISDLNSKSTAYQKYFSVDPILERVSSVFEGRIGKPYDEAKQKEMLKEGERRFEKKIPPGFKDKDKPGDRRYGDFFGWSELIEKSIEDKRNCIFVTGDMKEDWWLREQGRWTVGARPELFMEFSTRTTKEVLIYSLDKFLESSQSHFGGKLEGVLIEEVKQVQESSILSEKDDKKEIEALKESSPEKESKSPDDDKDKEKSE